MPEAMLNRLIRLAAFQNPEFYKAQSMRLSTWTSRELSFAEKTCPQLWRFREDASRKCGACWNQYGIRLTLRDERTVGSPIAATFQGELRPEQSRTP